MSQNDTKESLFTNVAEEKNLKPLDNKISLSETVGNNISSLFGKNNFLTNKKNLSLLFGLLLLVLMGTGIALANYLANNVVAPKETDASGREVCRKRTKKMPITASSMAQRAPPLKLLVIHVIRKKAAPNQRAVFPNAQEKTIRLNQ